MTSASGVVCVVDDDVSVRESIELLVLLAGWQPKLFDSAQEFLGYPRQREPTCLILDYSMPGLNGLDLQQRVARERPDLPIIFITGYGDVPMTVKAMKAGAVEFLTKPLREDVLIRAITSALERSRSNLDQETQVAALQGRFKSLSPREREVMALVVSGLPNKQVASELGISEVTVKAHRGSLMRKMNADSLAHLVTLAAHLGVDHVAPVSPPDHASRLRLAPTFEGSTRDQWDESALSFLQVTGTAAED